MEMHGQSTRLNGSQQHLGTGNEDEELIRGNICGLCKQTLKHTRPHPNNVHDKILFKDWVAIREGKTENGNNGQNLEMAGDMGTVYNTIKELRDRHYEAATSYNKLAESEREKADNLNHQLTTLSRLMAPYRNDNKSGTKDDEMIKRGDQIRLNTKDIIVLKSQEIQLLPLTPDMRKLIENSVVGRENEEVVTSFNIIITKRDLNTLAPSQWLNDNVINFYMELIGERAGNGNTPSAYIFSTFFYSKFIDEGYSNMLKRWTRKINIFSMDLIIFPIHLGNHWCLAVADLRNKTIKSYDSLHGRNERCLKVIFSYLNSEHKERMKCELKSNEWRCTQELKIPVQENETDCGVFTCKFAEYLSRDARITFGQKDIKYYRDRMVYEIVTKTLIYP